MKLETPEVSAGNSSDGKPLIAMHDKIDPHSRHPVMAFEVFICLRFMLTF
jgi:hypothetical protein